MRESNKTKARKNKIRKRAMTDCETTKHMNKKYKRQKDQHTKLTQQYDIMKKRIEHNDRCVLCNHNTKQ